MPMLGLKETAEGVFPQYVARFSGLEPRPAGLHALRQRAFARFAEMGFPGAKHEAWRQSNVSAIARTAWEPSEAPKPGELVPKLRALELPGVDWSGGATRLVFVNGVYAPGLSAVGAKGIRAGSLAERFAEAEKAGDTEFLKHFEHEDEQDQAFVLFNTAFLSDGAYVEIPAKCVLERPIAIVHVTTTGSVAKGLNQQRTLVLAGRESQATVIETTAGFEGESYLNNAVSGIELGENARLEYVRIEQESGQSYQVAKLRTRQARDSRLSLHTVTLGQARGAGWVRNNVHAILDGQNAECTLTGLYVISGTQHVDNSTVLDHAQPLCTSREFYKGVLDDKAVGIFNGRIIVRQDAQHTDAIQSNKNLLLSDAAATASSQPQLEIYADDVRCTHGATVGQLDPQALFYLRSRGLGVEESRKLLIHAFAADVLGRIQAPGLREGLEAVLWKQWEG